MASGCGSILWLAAAALMLEAADTGLCSADWWGDSYDRSVAAGVLGLAACIAHAVDSYFVFRHLDE